MGLYPTERVNWGYPRNQIDDQKTLVFLRAFKQNLAAGNEVIYTVPKSYEFHCVYCGCARAYSSAANGAANIIFYCDTALASAWMTLKAIDILWSNGLTDTSKNYIGGNEIIFPGGTVIVHEYNIALGDYSEWYIYGFLSRARAAIA